MHYSKYACDVCGATAEPDPDKRNQPPAGWEPFILMTSSCNFQRDLCPSCVKRPLADLLKALRKKESQP